MLEESERASEGRTFCIAVLSDTHGLLRPQVLEHLSGADLIVHAGDVGSPMVLRALQQRGPVRAVRGNVDREGWAQALPLTASIELGGRKIYVLHNLEQLFINPALEGVSVIISGHSHKPRQYEKEGVLYFNPGSAGPRRFRLPISMGRLWIEPQKIRAEWIELEP